MNKEKRRKNRNENEKWRNRWKIRKGSGNSGKKGSRIKRCSLKRRKSKKNIKVETKKKKVGDI